MKSRLTDKERKAFDKTVELVNCIHNLEKVHAAETPELIIKIHDIQARILMRPELRIEQDKKTNMNKC